MRLFFLIFSIVIFLSSCFKAQVLSAGIYITANNFVKKQPEFTPKNRKIYKVKQHYLFNNHLIKIKYDTNTIILNTDTLYGYCNTKNQSFRFYRQKTYAILNPNEIELLLYSLSYLGGYKHSQIITNYYFSTTTSTQLIALTVSNLKIAYGSNLQFCNLLSAYINTPDDLLNYNATTKTYLLNTLLKKQIE